MRKKGGLTKKEVSELKKYAQEVKKMHPDAIVLGLNADFGECTVCGSKDEELRPYGKGGANICFSCGQKNLKETETQMRKYLLGE